jgi:hypothetical protein
MLFFSVLLLGEDRLDMFEMEPVCSGFVGMFVPKVKLGRAY